MTDSRESGFRFSDAWWLPAQPAAVYAVLAHPENYPRWWPEVREVVRTGPDTGRCRFRSVLPMELRVGVRAVRREPAAGVLELALTGDLDGRLCWTLTPADGGTCARYAQDAVLRRRVWPGLRRLSRPVFAANHALMMRSGRRGLRAWLGVHLDDR